MGSCCAAQNKKKSPDHGHAQGEDNKKSLDHGQGDKRPSEHRQAPKPKVNSRKADDNLPTDKKPIVPKESQLSAAEQEQRRKQLADAAEQRLKSQKIQGFTKESYIDYQFKKQAQDRAVENPRDQKLLTFKMG
jgi:hypothetical protein